MIQIPSETIIKWSYSSWCIRC